MAGSLNKVMIIGNLGKDPEVRSFQNGGRVCNLRVATSESWKDKQTGEKKERTEWHSVTIHNDALIGIAEKYMKKGTKAYFEGQLETRKWQDQGGNDRYSTEIVLRPFNGNFTILSGGVGQDEDRGSRGGDDGGGGYGDQRQGGGSGAGNRDMDDEIPF